MQGWESIWNTKDCHWYQMKTTVAILYLAKHLNSTATVNSTIKFTVESSHKSILFINTVLFLNTLVSLKDRAITTDLQLTPTCTLPSTAVTHRTANRPPLSARSYMDAHQFLWQTLLKGMAELKTHLARHGHSLWFIWGQIDGTSCIRRSAPAWNTWNQPEVHGSHLPSCAWPSFRAGNRLNINNHYCKIDWLITGNN